MLNHKNFKITLNKTLFSIFLLSATFILPQTALAKESAFQATIAEIISTSPGPERLLTTASGEIQIHSYTGELLPTHTISIPNEVITSSPILADINADNTQEIIFTSRNTGNQYSLHAYNSSTSTFLATSTFGSEEIHFDPTPIFNSTTGAKDVLVTTTSGFLKHFQFQSSQWVETDLVNLNYPIAATSVSNGQEIIVTSPQQPQFHTYTFNGSTWTSNQTTNISTPLVYPPLVTNNTLYGINPSGHLTAFEQSTGNLLAGFPIALDSPALGSPSLTASNQLSLLLHNGQRSLFNLNGNFLGNYSNSKSFPNHSIDFQNAIVEQLFISKINHALQEIDPNHTLIVSLLSNLKFDIPNLPPTHETPVLISELGTDTTEEDLIVTAQNLSDPNQDATKVITNWVINSSPFATLNLPFEKEDGAEITVTKDYSGLSQDATINGATFHATGGADNFGYYNFNGINNDITIPHHDDLNPGDNSFTISIWAKPTGTQEPQAGLIKKDGGNDYYILQTGTGNTINFALRDNSGTGNLFNSNSINPLIVDQWNHIAAIIDRENQQLRIYLNGQLESITTVNIDEEITPLGQLKISHHVSYFNGSLDEITLYKKALSENQIQQIHNQQLTTLSADETTIGETWEACLTPHDANVSGETKCSNSLSIIEEINNPPSHDTPILTSEFGTDTTNEDLIVIPQNLNDPESDPISLISTWKVNNNSTQSLNLPFEGGTTDLFAKDYSETNNDAILFNTTHNPTGDHNNNGSLHFNGVNSYGSITHHESLNPHSGDISISLWIKPNGIQSIQSGVIKKEGGIGGYYLLEFSSNNKLYFSIRDNPTGETNLFSVLANTPLNDNQWNHVVAILDRSDQQLKLYINGILDNQATTNIDEIIQPLANAIIGKHMQYFNGELDDIQLFNRVLSPKQIQLIFSNQNNILASEETLINEIWQACITPNDGKLDGTEQCSNQLQILSP